MNPPARVSNLRHWFSVLTLSGLLALLLVAGWHGAWRNAVDFEYFYKAGRALLDHGALDNGLDRSARGAWLPRGRLDWYMPAVSRLMTVPAFLPPTWAGIVWLFANLTAFAASLCLLAGRCCARTPLVGLSWVVGAALCLPLALYWEFRLNQVDTLTLLLLLGGWCAFESGRRALAGFWFGLAILLKITPGLLLPWLLLKRQFATAAVALITLAAAGPLADAVALGPEYAQSCYAGWFKAARQDAAHAALIQANRELDWRNQGCGAVLARWLTGANWRTHYDNEPRAAGEDFVEELTPLRWPRAAVGRLVTGVLAAGLVILAWISRQPASRLPVEALRTEFVLWLVAMLLCMPVLRRYHLILALPALLAVLIALRDRLRPAAAWPLVGVVAAVAVPQWFLLSTATPNHFEAGGGLWLSLLVLAGALVFLRLQAGSRRSTNPNAIVSEPALAGRHA